MYYQQLKKKKEKLSMLNKWSRRKRVHFQQMVKNSVWTNASVEAMMGGAGGDDQLIQSRPWNNPL